MKIKNLILKSLVNTLGIGVYISLVVVLINTAGHVSIKMPGFLGPMAMLLLFVLSAAITGALFVGEPILFYLSDKRKDAVKLFIYTIGWMVVLLILVASIIVSKYQS